MSVPTLGERLRFLRKEKLLSQAKLSKKIQISRQAYSAYERDVRMPNYQTLCKLTEIFDVPLEFLLSEYTSDTNKYAASLKESTMILQEEEMKQKLLSNDKIRYENLGDEEQKLIDLYLQANDIARKKTMAYLEQQVHKGKENKKMPSLKGEKQLHALQKHIKQKKITSESIILSVIFFDLSIY